MVTIMCDLSQLQSGFETPPGVVTYLPLPPIKAAPKRRRKRNRAQLKPIPWGQPDAALARALCEDWIDPAVRHASLRGMFGTLAGVGGCLLLLAAVLARVTA